MINDWSQNLLYVQLSTTLDGDVTIMNSQILLQEQGFILSYPAYLGFIITSVLKEELRISQNAESKEYYLDTYYFTDPDKLRKFY